MNTWQPNWDGAIIKDAMQKKKKKKKTTLWNFILNISCKILLKSILPIIFNFLNLTHIFLLDNIAIVIS